MPQRPTLGRSRPGRSVSRDSIARRIVIDAGAAATRRHAIPAWFTADVTDVVARLDRDPDVSITTYVVATVADAVARHPRMHASRDYLASIRGAAGLIASRDGLLVLGAGRA